MSDPAPTLRGDRVVLRPVTAADRPRLREILAEPSVARWWNPGTPDHAVANWLDDSDAVILAIDVAGDVAGSIQFYEEPDADYRHASIDLFLATAFQDQGLGSEAIRVVARHLIVDRGHHRLTIDPAAANARAIHAYERVGFRRVGIMRSYERGSDGTWHDGLLMDMLAGELI